MSNQFNNRCFGAVIVKSVNSNWNADFTHSPRTLPDGTIYATDKALKYAIRDYIRTNHPDEKVFFFKRLNQEAKPVTLEENYNYMFGELNKPDKKEEETARKDVIGKLLSCIDIRMFGATFAAKNYNFSIHGSVQVNHAVDRLGEFEVYAEQIMSPFRNPSEAKAGSDQSTLGSQTNLKEGHYVYHFSINPANLNDLYELLGDEVNKLSDGDIKKLIDAMNRSVTLLDSSRKIGSENEATIFVKLKEGSKIVLPSFTDLIDIEKNGDSKKRKINLKDLDAQLESARDEIEEAVIYHNPLLTEIDGISGNVTYKVLNIVNGKEV
ncbi:MAG: type I CRISPR-associated protein Cas7 [bacterium]